MKDTCSRGHEFTPEDTYVDPDGNRRCLVCKRNAANRRYREKKGLKVPREPLTWQNAYAADGPKVAEWVASNIVLAVGDDAAGRRLSDWRAGGSAEFYTLDRLLIRYGRHVSDLPDDVWTSSFRPRRRQKAKAKKVELVPRFCETCEKKIPPDRPSRYKERRYCSRECQWKGLATTKKKMHKLLVAA